MHATNNIEILTRLVESGGPECLAGEGDVYLRDGSCRTLNKLCQSAALGWKSVVEFCLDLGMDADLQTAVKLAKDAGHTEIVELLRDYRASHL